MFVNRPTNEADAALKAAVSMVFRQAGESGISVATLAAHLHKSAGNVYKYGMANDHSVFISAHDLPLLAQITDVTPILEALCALCGGKFLPGDQEAESPENIRGATLRAVKEVGDVTAAVEDSLADGALNPDEKRRITTEVLEAKGKLDALLGKLKTGKTA